MPGPVNRIATSRVDAWLTRLGRLLYPARCPICREVADEASGLCAACAARLPWLRAACDRCALPLADTHPARRVCGDCLQRAPPLRFVQASFLYGFPLDRLLPRFKFHRDLACGRLLSQWMLPACAAAPRPGAVLPVPLHATRLRERGYDQALELARPLARALDLPLRADLVRMRATAAQSSLDAGARRRNLRGAFVVDARRPLPEHVALVDDVMTTGATLHAAARALHRAGVARVDAWVCARVP
ncbi:ComF family protein [Luteimonas sp. MHLX1A]|uniref:ComF family protein n=1 Tax=Alterluteimonas muca TaxID=2878684 RepID=UPI001E4B3E2B|nr:ComF family protein [Luteimonas sp. MHLX1A]MCD9047946.1 ComF family protein [Luteimonas sp. MHLX1A]